MSTIPTSLTENQFKQHVLPYLSVAQRGYVCRIPLYKVFNYLLYRFHTGCQWQQLPMAPDEQRPEKKNSAITPSIITFGSGAATVVWKKCGKAAL